MTELYDLLSRDYDPKLREALIARGNSWFFDLQIRFRECDKIGEENVKPRAINSVQE